MSMTMEQTQEILHKVAQKHGGVLKPEEIVREAEPLEHPLHDHFNWDDKSAAHAHRIEQARQLIKVVQYHFRIERREISAPFYVRDPDAGAHESGYVSVPRLQTEPQRAAAVLSQEFGRVLDLLERARDMAIILGQDAAVDDIVLRLRSLAGRVAQLKVA